MSHHLLLIVTDGELEVTWDNTLLLVITSRVTGKLKDLSSEVLEDSREVNYGSNAPGIREPGVRLDRITPHTGSTSTNTLGVVTLLQETVDTADGELETRLRRAGLALPDCLARGLARLGLATALARHCV